MSLRSAPTPPGSKSTTTSPSVIFATTTGAPPFRRHPDGLWLIVPVVGGEAHGQLGAADSPVGTLPDASVGHVAECAVSASDPGPQEVRELAQRRAVGVVHAREPFDRR